MRIWDIVDKIYPDVPIVETQNSRRRLRGITWSAAHCVFTVSLVVASSGTFSVARPAYDSNYTQSVQVSAENFMSPEIGATLSAMKHYRFEADVANQEPEDEEPIGYSYPT